MKPWGTAIAYAYLCILCSYYASATEVTSWICHNGDRISEDWLCDGQTDCADGSDELAETCPDRTCREDQFRCNNTRCIHISFRCNGEADCSDEDHSDELGCTPRASDVQCENKFKCRSGDRCLPTTWVCDGERDCLDSSDEFDCLCKHDTYGCYVHGVSLCLRNATKCDGIRHCDNGEDENCDTISRPWETTVCSHPGMYQCRNGRLCVPWKLVCDGIADCKDRSDEDGLCHVNDCGHQKDSKHNKKKACEQYCNESPDGGICTCGDGFILAEDGVHCLDVDECSEMLRAKHPNEDKSEGIRVTYEYGMKKLCSQKCVNLPGGFRCTCDEGYQVDADGFTCKALGAFSPDLFVAIGNEIRVFSLRGPGDKTLYYDEAYKSERQDESIIGMDMDITASKLFWIEDKSGQLKSKTGETVAAMNLGFRPSAVCADWLTGNLYVSAKKEPDNVVTSPAVYILATATQGHHRKEDVSPLAFEILSSGLESPVALAVHPHKGILLVADAGRGPGRGARILVSNEDGENVRDLLSQDMLTPTDLVIDYPNDVVFWSSIGGYGSSEARIESARLDGSRREIVLSQEYNRFPIDPVSIATFEGHLYISDKVAREVRSWKTTEIPLFGNENTMYASESLIKQRRSRFGSVRVSHPVLQRPMRGVNPCRSAGCSHICVLVPSVLLQVKELLLSVDLRARCLCPSKYQLLPDKSTCEEIAIDEKRVNAAWKKPTSPKTAPRKSATTTAIPSEMVCSNPGSVENAVSSPIGVLSLKNFAPGTTIRYYCLKGFVTQSGLSSRTEFDITCNHGGKWSGPILQCVKESTSVLAKIVTAFDPPSWKNVKLQSPKDGIFKTGQESGNITRAKAHKPTRARTGNSRKLCLEMRCEPWGRCVKNAKRGYKCVCSYGESADSVKRCLPPNSSPPDYVTTGSLILESLGSTPSMTAYARTLIPKPSGLTPSMTALVVVAVCLCIATMVLCYKCMRRKRYSVDLRYFRGRTTGTEFAKESSRESAVIECSFKGKPASITNPNYSSPSQRKRLPKPTFRDDLSDSGIQQSLGSASLSSSASSSSSSAGEGTSGSTPTEDSDATGTVCPLLHDELHQEESETLHVHDSMGDLVKSPGPFRGRIGRLFKMRKTESRECMLPKTALRKSKSSRG